MSSLGGSHRAAVFCVAALSAGWQGAGDGVATWRAGELEAGDKAAVATAASRVAVSAVGRIDRKGPAVVVVTLALPDEAGDAVLTLELGPTALDRAGLRLPHRAVRLVYAEYGPDGEVRFGTDAVEGTFQVQSAGREDALVFSADLALRAPPAWRRLTLERLELRAVRREAEADPGSPAPAGGEVAAAPGTGCDTSASDPFPPPEPVEHGAATDSDGGCGGDDLDEPETTETDGGCGGDDVDGGADPSSGCDDSCTGDAVASAGGVRRGRGWAARLIGWLPWFMVFAAIRLLRRTPRRARAGRPFGYCAGARTVQ